MRSRPLALEGLQSDKPAANKPDSKPAAQKENSVAKEDTNIDISKLTPEQMFALSQQLQARAKEASSKIYDSTMTMLNEKLTSIGYTKTQAVMTLVDLMDDGERKALMQQLAPARKPRAAKGAGAAKKQRADTDKEGKNPEPGKTYVLNGTSWTKNANGKGATKREFVEAVKGGMTWAELLKK